MITNRSMPPAIIIPELAYRDVRAATLWLCKTFGFKEQLRIGSHRRQLVFGEASVIVIELSGEPTTGYDASQPRTHKIMVQVPDVDQHYGVVKESEAKILSGLETYPFGERQYTVEDPGGHMWTFTQSVADVDPKEWARSVSRFLRSIWLSGLCHVLGSWEAIAAVGASHRDAVTQSSFFLCVSVTLWQNKKWLRA